MPRPIVRWVVPYGGLAVGIVLVVVSVTVAIVEYQAMGYVDYAVALAVLNGVAVVVMLAMVPFLQTTSDHFVSFEEWERSRREE